MNKRKFSTRTPGEPATEPVADIEPEANQSAESIDTDEPAARPVAEVKAPAVVEIKAHEEVRPKLRRSVLTPDGWAIVGDE
jgi:hypothetical protein